MYGKFIDVPELEKLPDPERAREIERAMKDLAGYICRELMNMETKMKKIEKMIGEMRK